MKRTDIPKKAPVLAIYSLPYLSYNVSFENFSMTTVLKRYDYLLDREDIVPGDYVLVENDKHPEGAEAFVLEVKEKSAHELALPLGRYKRVLGKVKGPT